MSYLLLFLFFFLLLLGQFDETNDPTRHPDVVVRSTRKGASNTKSWGGDAVWYGNDDNNNNRRDDVISGV